MANVKKMPVKAPESPETGDIPPEQAKVLLAQNEALRGLLAAVQRDLLALRDAIGKAL